MKALLFPGGVGNHRRSLISRVRANPFHYLVLLICLINISLVMVNVGLWVKAAYEKLFIAADFTSFYTGFYMVRVGEGAHLYDPALQASVQQQFMGGLEFEGGVLLFPNPPFVAIAFSPLSYLSLDAAYYAWTAAQIGLLIWIISILNHLFSHWDKRERFVMFITILAFWPLAYSLLLGQFSVFLLLGLLQMCIHLRNSKFSAAGLWMFVLAIKPQTLLTPGTAVLNKRYWRVALVLVLTTIAAFIISILIIGFQPWLGYLQTVKGIGSYFGEFGVTPATEYTIRGVLTNLLGNTNGNLTNVISITLLVAGMVLIWLLWRRDIPPMSSRFILYFAFTVLLSLFTSFHQNPHDSLLLVVPAVLLYDYLRKNDHPYKVYALILLLSPLIFLFTSFYHLAFFGIIRPPVLIIIAMIVWTIRYMLIDDRSEHKTDTIGSAGDILTDH